MLLKHCLYLRRLYPISSQLHLPVFSPYKFQLPFSSPPHHISCSVDSLSLFLAPFVRHELLCRLTRIADISTPYSSSSDVQLAYPSGYCCFPSFFHYVQSYVS